MERDKVSIVIPIRKEEDISRLIKSIENSTYKNIEIIVVDEGKERSVQRNIGIKKATGKFIFIPDSDWELTPKLIAECVHLMDYRSALYIPEIIKTEGLFAKLRNWERQFYTATPIDVVRFVKTKDCPLFDEEQTGPEDSDWDRRISRIRGVTSNPYYHWDNISFLKYFNKKAYYSKSIKRFEERNPNDKILDFKWRCFGVFFEQGKWKRCLLAPHLFVAVMVLIFIRGVIYMVNK